MITSSELKKVTEITMCETHGEFEKVFIQINDGMRIASTEGGHCPRCASEKLEQLAIDQKNQRVEHETQQVIYRTEHFAKQIPKRFQNATLENYITSNEQQVSALNLCKKYLSSYKSRISESGGGLILTGKVGTGKTHIAIGLGKLIAEQFAYVNYISLTSLVREIRSTWNDPNKHEETIISNYQNTGMLIVDEIGVQNGTENERNILFEIIDGRYQRILPTIIISNLSIDEVSQMISQRSVDRITQGGAIIPFDWVSHRGSL